MKFFHCSLILACCGCASAYHSLEPVPVESTCLDRIRPGGIQTTWFDTSVDITGRHISGLMLIKNMPDGTTRVVFTNEAGVKFLDFEFGPGAAFRVVDIMEKLDKKPVVQTLRKDFALMLGIPFLQPPRSAYRDSGSLYFAFPQKKETVFLKTDSNCSSLHSVEVGTPRKRKVTVFFYGPDPAQPDSISLQHHTFAMSMRMRKIEQE